MLIINVTHVVDVYCTQYILIDDPLRSVNYASNLYQCDDTLTAGWYRFMINGINAKIPTSCPLPTVSYPYICTSAAAGWYSGKFDGPIRTLLQ